MACGMWPWKTMSETAKRPPGTRTRWASRSTLPLSAERLITQLEITTSTVLSGKGISSTTTEFYHSMRLQRNASHTSIYPCYYWQVSIDYLLARRENSSTALFTAFSLYLHWLASPNEGTDKLSIHVSAFCFRKRSD